MTSPPLAPPRTVLLSPGSAGLLGLKVGLAQALLQVLLLLQPARVELDPEELYNAGHAALVAELGPGALLPLQYRPYCGGCTLDASLGALLYAVLPPSLLVWKLVPIGLGALALGLLCRALARHVSVQAALATALLAIWTPPAWSLLGLVGWGNHFEASAVVLMALAAALAPARPATRALLGLLLGLGLWVGLSAAFAVPVVLGWMLLRGEARLLPAWAAGLLLGLSPALLRWGVVGESPWATVYQAGEAVPALSRLPHKLSTLLPPRQLAGLLGVRDPTWGPPAGIAAALTVAVAALAALRRPGPPRLVAGLLAGWLGVYLLVRFQVAVSPEGVVPTAPDVRYAAPALALCIPLLGVVAGGWWAAGRRLPAALLLGPLLAAGVSARLLALAAPFPVLAAARMRGPDLDYLREQASWALSTDWHRRGLALDDPALVRVHAYALGRDAWVRWNDGAGPPIEPLQADEAAQLAWAEGVAAALVDQTDPEADGDRADLLRALARLDEVSADWPAAMRRDAFAEALWRRVDGGAPDALLAPLPQGEGLAALLAGPTLQPEAAWQALWRVAGRRWGRDRAPRWVPSSLPLPTAELAGHDEAAAFAEGLGFALGEAWGPAAQQSPPPALPASWQAPYQRGARSGAARRWLLSSEATEPAEDPGGLRR